MSNDSRGLASRAITELKPFTGTVAASDRTAIWDASKRKVMTIPASRTEIIPGSGASVTIIDTTGGGVKAGATSGWVIDAGSAGNIGHFILTASRTSSTAVVPIFGLEVGEKLTAVALHGQSESGGNTVSLTMSVRKLTTAASDVVDAQLGTITLATTADTAYSAANMAVTGLTETLAEGETVYVLLTGTTGASCDIDIAGISVTKTLT